MDENWARTFVNRWVTDWNSHDLEAVLGHYHHDAVFTSPVALRVLPESGGVLRGRDQLRHYWATALARVPDLHFEIVTHYTGVDTLVINYRNQKGGLVNEVLTFDGALVIAGHGTYQVAEGNPAGVQIE